MILVLALCVAILALGVFASQLRDRFPRRSRRGQKKLRYFAVNLAKDETERPRDH